MGKPTQKNKAYNRDFLDALAITVAKEFLDNESCIIRHLSSMSGVEAAYFAFRVVENLGEMQGNSGPKLRALATVIVEAV